MPHDLDYAGANPPIIADIRTAHPLAIVSIILGVTIGPIAFAVVCLVQIARPRMSDESGLMLFLALHGISLSVAICAIVAANRSRAIHRGVGMAIVAMILTGLWPVIAFAYLYFMLSGLEF